VLTDLQSQIATSTELAGAGIALTTSSAGNRLTFTSASGEKFNVMVTGDTTDKLGFGSFLAAEADGAIDYTTTKAASAYSTGIAGGTGNAVLEVSLNGEASSAHALRPTPFPRRTTARRVWRWQSRNSTAAWSRPRP
jgi:hypothetical protein